MPNVLCICILSFAIHGERASKKTCAYSSMSLPVIVWCKMHQETCVAGQINRATGVLFAIRPSNDCSQSPIHRY